MDTTNKAVEAGRRRRRRRHSAAFKAQVMQACRHPGVSIAAVALSHGLNANLVRRWLNGRGSGAASNEAVVAVERVSAPADAAGTFVPVRLGDQRPAAAHIRLELCRGPATVIVNWPVADGAACGAWLHAWLR